MVMHIDLWFTMDIIRYGVYRSLIGIIIRGPGANKRFKILIKTFSFLIRH